ncbi:hypothetical protein ACFOHS_06575 [Jhaorihella thermophila]
MLALNDEDVTASNAYASGGEPFFRAGRGIGRVTSGGLWPFRGSVAGAGICQRRRAEGRGRGDGAGPAAPGADPAPAVL